MTGDPAGLARNTQTEDGINNFTIIQSCMNNTILRPKQNILAKQPPQKNRVDWINELFDGLDGWNIYIDLRCRKLTEDLVYQIRNEDGTKNKQKVTDPKTKVRYEKFGHNSDVFDYVLCTFLSKSWLKYQRGGQTGTVLTTSTIKPQFSY